MRRSTWSTAGPRAPGFTLIEILVVLAVIGLLVALLLPAVQAARATALRLQCVNNLKQIGLALASYEAGRGCYPFGVGGGGPPGREPRWSAQSQLLPYLEQGPLFDALNFAGVPWFHDGDFSPMNFTPLSTRVATFLCPADSDGIDEPLGLDHVNYRASAGTLPRNLSADTGTPGGTARNDGVFWYMSAIRPADIRDGLSATAVFSERCLGSSALPDPLADYYLIAGQPMACRQVDFRSTPRYTSDFEWSGGRWGDGNVFYARYHHILPPQAPSCVLGGDQDHGSPVVVSASSRHRGGVNLLMADGSVRFVKESIATAPWMALGTIRGGEVAVSE